MGDASHVRVWMLVFFFFLPPFSPFLTPLQCLKFYRV